MRGATKKAGSKNKSSAFANALMERAGWPAIPFDGRLLMSQQDALLLGGKVTAGSALEDHVAFVEPRVCEACRAQVCIEICSGEAIRASARGGTPDFDREKCVHCGACLWNCAAPSATNVAFRAGSCGLHSAEN